MEDFIKGWWSMKILGGCPHAIFSANLSSNEIGNLILNQVKGFANPGNHSDDMTLMIIKRNIH